MIFTKFFYIFYNIFINNNEMGIALKKLKEKNKKRRAKFARQIFVLS